MQQDHKFRFAIENTTMEVYWVDTFGRFVDSNRAACLALGYTRDELLALAISDIAPNFPPDQWQPFLQRLRDEGHQHIESIHRRKDGSQYPVEIQISLLQTDGEELICGFAQDISIHRRAEQALRESTERYRSVIETARDGFWVVDMEARLLEVNDTYCRQSGYNRDELLGKSISDMEAEEDPEATARHIETVMRDGNDLFETRHRRKNGDTWPVEVSVSFSPVEGGRFFVFLRDIHERRLTENLAELRRQLGEVFYQGDMEQLMQSALDAAEALTESRIGFFHFVERDQENLSLQAWSTRTLREMCSIKGEDLHYPVSEAGVWVDSVRQRQAVIHNDYASLPHQKGMPEGHPPVIRELTMPVFREGLIVGVMGVGNKDRDYSSQDVEIISRVADMAFDFIERKQAKQHVEHMAYYDTLTGLPNQVLLSDRLNQAIALHRRNGQLLAVCYLDLDGFKPVNDSYGHAVGDALLVTLAQRLQAMLREGDSLARLSGDEFVILLAEMHSMRESESIVRRLLEAIDAPFEIKGHSVRVSGSIGITLFPTDDATADTLLRHANQAMYEAKAGGKGDLRLYDPVQDQKLRTHRNTIAEINLALQRQELVLHYQPRVDLRSGELVGVEALVRWQHPERGMLMPDSFLPYLEGETEEIALGQWVLKTALDQLIRWQEQGLNFPVSVNISPKHMQAEGFADALREVLADYPAGTALSLELEVLETSGISDTAHVASVMRACTELGVSFSLDDFGTGYSSLTYFHRLPIDVLKIDQNFVRNMIDNSSDLAIVEGVVRLAEGLKRPVVAEGVESVELGLLLLNMGCRYGQGYGIARPMPPERLPQWLEQWSRDNIWQQMQAEDLGDARDFELRVALFSHRRWLRQVSDYILSESQDPLPSLDQKGSLFSHWYKGLGHTRYGNRPLYAFIPPKHTRVLELAAQLLARADRGEREQARSRLSELNGLSDELIAMLQELQGD